MDRLWCRMDDDRLSHDSIQVPRRGTSCGQVVHALGCSRDARTADEVGRREKSKLALVGVESICTLKRSKIADFELRGHRIS